MSTFINNHWASKVVPPSTPNSHPSLFAKSRDILIKSVITSPGSCPALSRSTSPVSVSSATFDDEDEVENDDVWKYGIKAIPLPEPPVSRSTITTFAEIVAKPLVRDPEDPSKWIVEKVKAPLDKFAPSYVPVWLRELPAPSQSFMLPTATPFPVASYADKVIPSHLNTARNVIGKDTGSILASAPSTIALSPLAAPGDRFSLAAGDKYRSHFSALLAQQLEGQVQAMNNAKIHEIAITLDRIDDETFLIVVPGIREESPKLNIGDRMMLRPLDTINRVPATFVVEVQVVGLDKPKGGIYVKSGDLAAIHSTVPVDLKGNRKYQLEFKASTDNICDLQDAVRFAGHSLDHDGILSRWLWPQKEDHPLASVNRVDSFYDQDLNQVQRQAVSDIVTPGHTIPYLISGPPGTGKTKTIAEAALQVLRLNPDARILLCAPSNAAADTLVRRLKAHLLPRTMFRLNSDKRTFAEVPQTILPYCFVKDDKFALPAIEDLMQYRIVVATCSDSAILTKAKVTNVHIQHARDHFEKCLNLRSEPAPASLFWTHLLIDEAAQASEPETLVPIEVVLPLHQTVRPTMVLCGDRRQLGPVIASRLARKGGLDTSLLERLFNTGAYPDVNAERNFSRLSSCAYLVQNYRSMPAILMAPSGLFYQDSLIPSAKDVSIVKWSGLPNPNVPILFKGCETEDETTDEGASWYNEGEIDEVVKTIITLQAEQPNIQAKEIAVITPWREQVWRIRARLRSLGLHGVDVGPVESYQGAEFRVTILSCVRSRSRFIAADRHAGAGFYDSPKRFNVAITRAKELLVIIGNANLLKGDAHWRGLLEVMQRHKLYSGPKLQVTPVFKVSSNIEHGVRTLAARGKAWGGTDIASKT